MKFTEQYTRKQKSLLIGCLLGDGYLTKYREKRANSYLALAQSCKEDEYLEHKVKRLNEVGLQTNNIFSYNTKSGYCKNMCNSKTDPIYNYLRPKLYPNNNKTIRRKFLNWLDEEGLAFWYLDDGSCCKRYINNKPKGRYLRISTESFNYDEHQIIRRYFIDKWNISPVVCKTSRKQGVYYYLRFDVENSIKLINLIKDFVPKCMNYKIQFDYFTETQIPKESCTVCAKQYYT